MKTAYDTGSPETLVPASNCVGCPNNWFDESSSTSYVAGTNSHVFTHEQWAGECLDSTDTVCLDADGTQCVTGAAICLISQELQPPYEYSGSLGLGLCESDYDTAPNSTSFVEMWA